MTLEEYRKLQIGDRVVARTEITEGNDGPGDWDAPFPHNTFIHAWKGCVGIVEHIDEEGSATVRWKPREHATLTWHKEMDRYTPGENMKLTVIVVREASAPEEMWVREAWDERSLDLSHEKFADTLQDLRNSYGVDHVGVLEVELPGGALEKAFETPVVQKSIDR